MLKKIRKIDMPDGGFVAHFGYFIGGLLCRTMSGVGQFQIKIEKVTENFETGALEGQEPLNGFVSLSNNQVAIVTRTTARIYKDLNFDEPYKTLDKHHIGPNSGNLIANHFATSRGSLSNRIQGIYSLKEERVLWEKEQGHLVRLFAENLFSAYLGQIFHYEISTGEIKWTFNATKLYPELAQNRDYNSVNFIGISQGVLVIGFTKLFRLFGIDIETGEVLWDREKIVQYCQINSGRLISFGGGGYSDIDLRTGEKIDSFSDRDYFESHNFMCGRGQNILLGDHIIDTGSGGTIGAFNTITHTIDWLYTDPEVNSFPTASGFPMQYADGYLMLKDNEQTLHIYKQLT